MAPGARERLHRPPGCACGHRSWPDRAPRPAGSDSTADGLSSTPHPRHLDAWALDAHIGPRSTSKGCWMPTRHATSATSSTAPSTPSGSRMTSDSARARGATTNSRSSSAFALWSSRQGCLVGRNWSPYVWLAWPHGPGMLHARSRTLSCACHGLAAPSRSLMGARPASGGAAHAHD